jgi:hypothetical protein
MPINNIITACIYTKDIHQDIIQGNNPNVWQKKIKTKMEWQF